jgi:hypothetical protein
MMEAVRTSETSVDNHFTRQYIPEDNSEHHTRILRSENLKSHIELWLTDVQKLWICFQDVARKDRTRLYIRHKHSFLKYLNSSQ